MAAENDIEKKVRKISESKPDDGEEMQEFQRAQNELLGINSQRQANLQTERAVDNAESRNNENLAQAAQLAAAASLGGAGVAQIQSMNPRTQDILGKYGIGKPGTKTTRSQTRQVTPQNVVINNNTQTTTTNNVQVPPNVGGPIQGRAVQISPNTADSGMAKFKTWLTSVFAKQKEDAALRERAYQKKEWSLSRSGSKIMRKLESLGKTFSEKLNPKRIGSIFGDQLKTILFLLGFQYLYDHWEGFIKGLKKIEDKVTDFLGYLGFGEKGKATRDAGGFFKRLGDGIVKFLGGNENETVIDAFRGLFTELANLLGKKFEMFMESRGEAMRQIKFPDIDLTDIGGTLKGLGTYLGDILTCLVSGSKGVEKSIQHSVENTGLANSREYAVNNKGHKITDKFSDELSYGDAAWFTPTKDGYVARGLSPFAVDSSGELTKDVISTYSQSTDLDAAWDEARNGKVNTARVASGLSRLHRSATKRGMIPVDPEFVTSKFKDKAVLEQLWASKDIRRRKYKFVLVDKTSDDFALEGADPLKAWGENKLKSMAADKAAEISGGGLISNTGKYLYNLFDRGINYIGGSELGDLMQAADAVRRRLGAEDKKLKLVPVESDEGIPLGGSGSVELYEISPKVIDEMSKTFSRDGQVLNFNTADKDYLTDVQGVLEREAKKYQQRNTKTGKLTPIEYDIDVESTYKKLDNLKEFQENQEREFESWKEKNMPRTHATIENTKNLALDALSYGQNFLAKFGIVPESVRITGEEQRKNTKTAMEFFINKGLTPTQAAGIVGNFLSESGLNPGNINPHEVAEYGPTKAGMGIAQWTNTKGSPRADMYREWYKKTYGKALYPHETPLEPQLEYAWVEMNTRPGYLNAIKSANSYEEATDATLRGFENGGYDKLATVENMNQVYKASWSKLYNKDFNYYDHLAKRSGYAKSALDLYNSSGSEEKKSEVDVENEAPEAIEPQDSGVPPSISPLNPEINSATLAKGVYSEYEDNRSNGSVPELLKRPETKPSLVAVSGITGKPLKVTPESIKAVPGKDTLADGAKNTEKKSAEIKEATTGKVNTDILGAVKDVAVDIKEQKIAIATLADNIETLAAYAASTGNSVTVNNSPMPREKAPSMTTKTYGQNIQS